MTILSLIILIGLSMLLGFQIGQREKINNKLVQFLEEMKEELKNKLKQ